VSSRRVHVYLTVSTSQPSQHAGLERLCCVRQFQIIARSKTGKHMHSLQVLCVSPHESIVCYKRKFQTIARSKTGKHMHSLQVLCVSPHESIMSYKRQFQTKARNQTGKHKHGAKPANTRTPSKYSVCLRMKVLLLPQSQSQPQLADHAQQPLYSTVPPYSERRK
jgi:hypothetical protein